MALISLQLPPGLERNNTPYDTPGRWWDMNLVRWQSGAVSPVKGWERLTSTPLDSAVRKIYPYRDNANARIVLVGTEEQLLVDDDTYVDITPADFVPLSSVGINGGYGTYNFGADDYGTARPVPSPIYSPYAYWSFGNWGEDVILTASSDGRLFYYDSSSATTAPTVISGAPTGVKATLVTDERHVMAFGYTDGSDDFSRTVAWSSREDHTDWNFSSTTNTAGFQALSTGTPLLKGVKVKEGVLIFSYSDVFLGQYVGLPFVYGFQRLAETSMMHPDSVATFDGKAVWLSRKGFQIYQGGFVQALECPILKDIMAEMDPTYGPFRLHACANGVYPEVWFFYPTTGNTECNRYVIWNYAENWWGWGSLSRSAMATADTFKYPYMGSGDGDMFQHETGWTDAGASRVGSVWIETGALGSGDTGRTINIRQMMPATGFGYSSLGVRFYSRLTPEGPERSFGPYTPRADGYTDCRVSGRDARIRFEANDDGDWGIGAVKLDVAQGGGR